MKKILTYTIPIWLAMIINSFLGITDFWFLSKISQEYMSVVGIAYIPFSFISSLIVGVGIEANRATARGNKVNFRRILILVLSISSLLAIVAYSFSTYLLFFSWNNPMYTEIKTYFSIICYSLIPTSVLYICTGILRGKGLSHKTIKFSLLAVISNFILDYLFIKTSFFKSPLIGCAVATVISDCSVALIYVIYFIKMGFADADEMNLHRFINNAFTNSMEKFFSVSTIQIVSNIFLVNIDVIYSAVYFGLDRFFAPIMLFSYSFFEWILYSKSRHIHTGKNIYFFYFGLLIIYDLFLIRFMELNTVGITYSLIYVCYQFMFFIERALVADFFAEENGKIVNSVVLAKNILFLITLSVILGLNRLSLISFGIISFFFLFLEVGFLAFIQSKINIETAFPKYKHVKIHKNNS